MTKKLYRFLLKKFLSRVKFFFYSYQFKMDNFKYTTVMFLMLSVLIFLNILGQLKMEQKKTTIL